LSLYYYLQYEDNINHPGRGPAQAHRPEARSSKRTRSELFRLALRDWLAARRRRRLAAEDRAAYARQPVGAAEFSGLIAAQAFDDEAEA